MVLRRGTADGRQAYMYNRLGAAALRGAGAADAGTGAGEQDEGLQLLRLPSSSSSSDSLNNGVGAPASGGSSLASAQLLDEVSLAGGLAASSKLAVLDAFLQSIRRGDAATGGGRAKVVLVSSSTQMLDVVQLLAVARSWP